MTGYEKTKIFIKLFGMDIARAIADTPIFFATAVGQKCGESGFGTSSLAKKYNNFGGIRGVPKEAIGKTSNGWAIFRTPEDCFMSYARFLTEKKQYNKAMLAKSPEEQIKELVRAGYCEITPQMPSAEHYLRLCQSSVNAARDVCPTGRITRANIASTLQNINLLNV